MSRLSSVIDLLAVQYKPPRGRRAEALAALCGAVTAAAPRPGALIVLPEMAATGYLFASAAEVAAVAEPADGPTFRALAAVAKATRCWLVAGFPEAARDRFFNSALVIDPTGARRFVYRKTLLYDADRAWASPGDSGYARFDADGFDFTVGICMDLNDDAFVAWCAACRARAVAFPTNWIEEHEDVWAYWAWRTAALPGALVAANTYGPEGAIAFSGRSAILRRGRVLAAAPATGDVVVRARLPR